MLRLGVGYEARQPFFFVCPRCQAVTRGVQILNEETMKTSLELQDGAQLDSDDGCIGAISINPEFPSMPHASSFRDPGGSPFLMHNDLLGPAEVQDYLARVRGTANFAKGPLRELARLATYYLHSDWDRFEDAGRKLFRASGSLGNLALRDLLIGAAFEKAFSPFWTADDVRPYPLLRDEWDRLTSPDRPNFGSLVAFARTEVTSPAFMRLLDDLFKHALRYFEMRHAFLPGLLLDLYPPSARDKIPQLRLFRDDFEAVRDLYLQTFESCHKALRYVLGVANIDARGSADQFAPSWAGTLGPGERAPRRPRTLDDFDDLVNYAKGQWLAGLTDWYAVWPYSLDRKLRNDMGHASIRHELRTGLLIRDDAPPLHYTEFVETAHRIIHALLACVHVMLTVRRISRP